MVYPSQCLAAVNPTPIALPPSFLPSFSASTVYQSKVFRLLPPKQHSSKVTYQKSYLVNEYD
jgi:hypothetical protein